MNKMPNVIAVLIIASLLLACILSIIIYFKADAKVLEPTAPRLYVHSVFCGTVNFFIDDAPSEITGDNSALIYYFDYKDSIVGGSGDAEFLGYDEKGNAWFQGKGEIQPAMKDVVIEDAFGRFSSSGVYLRAVNLPYHRFMDCANIFIPTILLYRR